MRLSKSRNQLIRKNQFEAYMFWFAYFMAFPAIVIVQNISVFVFIALLFFLGRYSKTPLVYLRKPLQWGALLFAFGAILSVVNMPSNYATDSLERALSVLPNYLYWSLLILVMVTHRHRIDVNIIFKAIFWGTVSLVVYYLFLQRFFTAFFIFAAQTPNNFSFLLICFTPISIYYLFRKKGKFWALMLLISLVLIMLIEGRRAGMVLVLLGGLGTLYAPRINLRQVLLVAFVTPLFVFILSTASVEQFVLGTSERIHQMIYETEKIRKEDRSYLTRVAMVNKGLAIYEQYPYTGIGLNNFTNFNAQISKDFEGAKYVVNKADINKKSAHNSYVSILAEGGLFLLIPLLLLLGSLILYFVSHINTMPEYKKPVFWGIIGMSVHLYFISAIVNVFAWFLIALACALASRKY